MRIKTFEFLVSHCARVETKDLANTTFNTDLEKALNSSAINDYHHYQEIDVFKEPASPEEIDKVINNFMKAKEIKDIKISTYSIRRAGWDSVIMKYTILYA